MSTAANAPFTAEGAALIRASWIGVDRDQYPASPVELLSNDAIAHARELAAAGMGTVSFTANRRAAELIGLTGTWEE